MSERLYFMFLALVALERGVELWLSRRNAAWARARGGVEYGRGHLPWMKALHTVFLGGCALEVWFSARPFSPLWGWPCLGLALASQGLRYWTIASLGPRWNVGVIVLPGVPVEVGGPFRFLRHPNYLAVVIEGVAVPLIHSAFLTAALFTACNALLLSVRVRCEERALLRHGNYAARLGDRRRFWPGRA